MNLAALLKIAEAEQLPTALHNAMIDEAVSDLHSIKLDGNRSRCDCVIKLLKSLKQPPEKFESEWT